ncbi:MAG: CIA30 family protein [Pseudomonadota bacterium]
MADSNLLLDDFSNADGNATLGTHWQGFTDRVMGGRSDLSASYVETDRGMALRITGSVRLENNGGFIQVRLPLDATGQYLDISDYSAVELTVRGQPGAYYVHLRTQDNRRPWHYYSARLAVGPEWQTVRLPWSKFEAQGERDVLDLSRARSIAVVAYGERFEADIEVADIALITSEAAAD